MSNTFDNLTEDTYGQSTSRQSRAKIKSAAYCRVSTGSEEQVNSFKNQKAYFEREITKSKEFSLFKIYADQGISGTSLSRREEFTRMLYDAGLDETKINPKKSVFTASTRKPLFNRIFVKNTSRFARNVLVIDVLRELLKKGVFVYFLDINLVFDDIQKEFMLNMFLNFSQQESIDKSTKVIFGHKEGMKKGVIFTPNKIYGYKYHKETNELTIVEEEAAVIRKVYELYADGIGIRRIINALDEQGIKTRQGKSFVPQAIKRMLSQEKYYGALIRNKYNAGSVFSRKTPVVNDEAEWIVHENRVPAILSRELYDKVNKLRGSKVNHINQKGIYSGTSEFAGKIFCGKCGGTYTRNVDRGRAFFNCNSKKQKGTKACDAKNINESAIYEQIDDLRTNGLITVFVRQKDKHILKLRDQIDALNKRIDTPAVEQLEAKQSELAEIEAESEVLLRNVMKKKVSQALYDKLSDELAERKDVLLREVEGLSLTNEAIFDEVERIEARIRDIEALNVKDDYSREEILKLITRFVVTSKVVEFVTKKDNRNSSRREAVLSFELGVFDELAGLTGGLAGK
ncbi:MAG: recombinase family protein [Bacillota bacterium]